MQNSLGLVRRTNCLKRFGGRGWSTLVSYIFGCRQTFQSALGLKGKIVRTCLGPMGEQTLHKYMWPVRRASFQIGLGPTGRASFCSEPAWANREGNMFRIFWESVNDSELLVGAQGGTDLVSHLFRVQCGEPTLQRLWGPAGWARGLETLSQPCWGPCGRVHVSALWEDQA